MSETEKIVDYNRRVFAAGVSAGRSQGDDAVLAEVVRTGRLRIAIRDAAMRAGLLHNAAAALTDEQLVALLRNVGDLAHYARAHSR